MPKPPAGENHSGSVDTSGSGTLVLGGLVLGYADPASLAGSGTLALRGVARVFGTVSLGSDSTLTLSGSAGAQAESGSLSLSGSGALTASGTAATAQQSTGSVALSGSGALAPAGALSITGAVALTGAGSLALGASAPSAARSYGPGAAFRRLAGPGGESLGEQAAANAYAGTSGASIVRALNAKLGRTDQNEWLSIAACLDELSGHPDLGEGRALNNIPTP